MSDDWPRLAAAVKAAMEARFDTKSAFLRAADGMTNKPLDALLAGQPVAAKTLRRVERVLGWPPGAADKVLTGDTLIATVPTEDGGTTEIHGPPEEYWTLSEEDRATVDQVIRRMAATDS